MAYLHDEASPAIFGDIMRNMSFSMTTAQVRARTKTVTRRFGWWNLKPGTQLWAVEKSQGLKKGEKVVRICQIEVVSVCKEQVQNIAYRPDDLAKEGFPDMGPYDFATMLCRMRPGAEFCDSINRIEFKYI